MQWRRFALFVDNAVPLTDDNDKWYDNLLHPFY